MTYTRIDKRDLQEIREFEIVINFLENENSSVLVKNGNTKIICTASVEEKVPEFLFFSENKIKHGWLTAEYSMLPGSTIPRKKRERQKIDGRTSEIQRLIGRSLRSVLNLKDLGERTIWIDCDVIQADGGTRTSAITGSFVALVILIRRLYKKKQIKNFPIKNFVAAVSVGIHNGYCITDLKYDEDVQAEVDMNIVMLDNGTFVEIQGTAERNTFTSNELQKMLSLAKKGIEKYILIQKKILGNNLVEN